MLRWVLFRQMPAGAIYLRDMDSSGKLRTTTNPEEALKLSMQVAVIMAKDLNTTSTPHPWKVKATTCPAT